jgi:hypothetical protein
MIQNNARNANCWTHTKYTTLNPYFVSNPDAQSLLMLHLDAQIPGCCPLPVKTVDGKLSSLESICQEDAEGNRISGELFFQQSTLPLLRNGTCKFSK